MEDFVLKQEYQNFSDSLASILLFNSLDLTVLKNLLHRLDTYTIENEETFFLKLAVVFNRKRKTERQELIILLQDILAEAQACLVKFTQNTTADTSLSKQILARQERTSTHEEIGKLYEYLYQSFMQMKEDDQRFITGIEVFLKQIQELVVALQKHEVKHYSQKIADLFKNLKKQKQELKELFPCVEARKLNKY